MINFEDGEITIVTSEAIDEENLVKKPGSIQYWIRSKPSRKIGSFSISDVSLTGVDSGIVLTLADAMGREPRRMPEQPDVLYSVASTPFPATYTVQESFTLRATISIFSESDKTPIVIPIELLLKHRVGKDRHWNWFDKIMSV